MIFLVFLTQFSIFTIAEAVWTAECADKWLFFVQQNEADKKNWKICFWGVENLKLWPIFDWIRWKYTILKSCVLMWHTCPHMSIFGLQIHNTYTTQVKKCVLLCVVLDSSLVNSRVVSSRTVFSTIMRKAETRPKLRVRENSSRSSQSLVNSKFIESTGWPIIICGRCSHVFTWKAWINFKNLWVEFAGRIAPSI